MLRLDNHSKLFLVTAMLLLTALAHASERSEYREAKKAEKVRIWSDYLERYPDGKYSSKANEARERLCQREWDIVVHNNMKSGFLSRFVDDCYGTANEATARQAIEDDDWRVTGGLDELLAFIDKYPESPRRAEAEERIRAARASILRQEWEAARSSDNVAEVETFLSKHPNSEYAEQASALVKDLRARELPRAAKKGDIQGVMETLAGASQDMRSEALMEAVWGLLHTGLNYRWNDLGMPEIFKERTSSVPEETYFEIVRALLESNADPRRFAYADFASNEVQAYQDRAKKEEFAKSVEEQGYGSVSTSFGTSELSGTYVDFGSGGLSIEQVAEIHKATELLALLRRRN